MRIPRATAQPPTPHRLENRTHGKFLIIGGMGFLASLLALTLILILIDPVPSVKTWLEHHGDIYRFHIHGVQLEPLELLVVPINWVRAILTDPGVPTLRIDITFKHLAALRAKRQEALTKGVLIQQPGDLVPAVIHTDDDAVRVRLRLKGDYLDHLSNDKWAFRVHVKGKNHILGLRRFSLHHPLGRHFHGEPVLFRALREEGILTPRYRFVDVILNGDFLGRMAMEEHFSSELLASQHRRESVILKFDESLVWDSEDGAHRGFGGVFDNIANTKVEPFRPARVARSPVLSAYLRIATGLLRGFAHGKLQASQVFDAERLGRFIAVAETWGAFHCLVWNNQRYYYNPVTSKLEPIAYDANTGHARTAKELIDRRYAIITQMLADPLVWNHYVATLKRWRQGLENGSIQAKLDPEVQGHLQRLHRYYPFLRGLNYGLFADRVEALLNRIRKAGGHPLPDYPRYLNAYITQDSLGTHLELENPLPAAIEILAIEPPQKTWSSPEQWDHAPFDVRLPFLLPGTPKGMPPHTIRVLFEHRPPQPDHSDPIRVKFRIQGQTQTRWVTATPYFPMLSQPPLPDPKIESLLITHPFLSFDPDQQQLHVLPGRWLVERPLIVPKRLGLRIQGGTTLQFAPHAFLVVQGPLTLGGTPDAPIILEGYAPHGKSQEHTQTWQGIVVLKSPAPSSWAHVTVRNTTGIEQETWQLTGGVTFYESPVIMDHCLFLGSRAEDALNIIRSTFTLKQVRILNTRSDGLDVDFSEGRIEESHFDRIGTIGGGDAIDLSGSQVAVHDTQIHHVSDKGLSVGEASTATALRVLVEHAGVGAASKDGSHLTVSHSTFSRIDGAALMAYVKKPEYGPGRIQAQRLRFDHVATKALAQSGNQIHMDGQVIPPVPLDVQHLYETSMKPGRDS